MFWARAQNKAMVHCRLRPRHDCMADSFSLGARRHVGHDAANTTQQGRYPAHDDAVKPLTATAPAYDMAHYVIHGYGLTCTTDVKIGRVVLGICSRRDAHTDKQTNRHAHHNTTLPYRGWSKNSRLRVVPWGLPNDFTERTR